jgi:hypothetical protein
VDPSDAGHATGRDWAADGSSGSTCSDGHAQLNIQNLLDDAQSKLAKKINAAAAANCPAAAAAACVWLLSQVWG